MSWAIFSSRLLVILVVVYLSVGNHWVGLFVGVYGGGGSLWACGGKLGRWFGHSGLEFRLELYNSFRFVGEMDGGWRRLAGEE